MLISASGLVSLKECSRPWMKLRGRMDALLLRLGQVNYAGGHYPERLGIGLLKVRGRNCQAKVKGLTFIQRRRH